MNIDLESSYGPVVIAGAHCTVTEALAICLEDRYSIPALTVSNWRELTRKLAMKRRAQLVIADKEFWETPEQEAEVAAGTPLAIISDHTSPEVAQAVLDGKLRGALTRGTPLSTMVAAIRLMLGGEVYLKDPDLIGSSVDGADGAGQRLSPRRRSIVSLVAAGYSNRRIAEEMGLTTSLVANEMRALFQYFEARNRTELAVRWRSTRSGD